MRGAPKSNEKLSNNVAAQIEKARLKASRPPGQAISKVSLLLGELQGAPGSSMELHGASRSRRKEKDCLGCQGEKKRNACSANFRGGGAELIKVRNLIRGQSACVLKTKRIP